MREIGIKNIEELYEWLLGFEKQETKKNEDAKHWIENHKGTLLEDYWRGYLERGKEILGEV